ncbi:eCIS core domain-containing protein [Nonomuraea sp. NPDC002799]
MPGGARHRQATRGTDGAPGRRRTAGGGVPDAQHLGNQAALRLLGRSPAPSGPGPAPGDSGSASAPVAQRSACGCHGAGGDAHPCADCASGKPWRGGGRPQRSPDTARPAAPAARTDEAALRPPPGSGRPLDPSVRQEMERHFGHDFGQVRVHTGDTAAQAAGSIHARAYTIGTDIVFGTNRHAPGTPAGRRLLAHELAHVVQQSGCRTGAPAGPQRDTGTSGTDELEQQADAAADALATAQAAPVRMTASISGLVFEPSATLTFRPGLKSPQLMSLVLERLVGPDREPGLDQKAFELLKGRFERTAGFLDQREARGSEPVGTITMKIRAAQALLTFLKGDKHLPVRVTAEQEELLMLGGATLDLWADFVSTLKETGNPLPAWYTRDIFERELAQQGRLLRTYAEQLGKVRAGAGKAAGRETVNDVIDALYGPVMILEAVRRDSALAADPAYTVLWGRQGGARLRSQVAAVFFLGYTRTQPVLARDALAYHAARAELLQRFGRYAERLGTGGVATLSDEELGNGPATANTQAFPSTLTSVPPTPPPLYEAALGTDHRMHMVVEYPSTLDALGSYACTWEQVLVRRIPDDETDRPLDATPEHGEQAKAGPVTADHAKTGPTPAERADHAKTGPPKAEHGERVETGQVAAERFNRATAYAKADIRRALDNMHTELGPAGVGALSLLGANAILRYLGTGIRLALDQLTLPDDQKLITFPSPGLYLIRASLAQVRKGGEEIVRVPSVAYLPVLARKPAVMAKAGVTAARDSRRLAQKRIADLQAMLDRGDLDSAERARIQEELSGLRLDAAPLGERLERRRAELAASLTAAIKAGATERSLKAATEDQEKLDKIIKLRGGRALAGAESLNARFVSDLGQNLPLSIEVADRPPVGGRAQVYISDVTTAKSGDGTGTGRTREEAIVAAVRELLESIHGYGRGQVALELGGEVRTIRIEASLGGLLSEAVDNVATVASIAAIAAAPFTGGASLSLLVPIGLVGAIPSAYRVAKRVEAGTFELDVENALEIANIAGAVVGLNRLGATSLQMVRLGRGLMIVGFGIDAANGVLMGAQFLKQLDELNALEPGERASALLMLIGQHLLSAGIIAGGAAMEHAQQVRAEAAARRRAPEPVPGLHTETPSGPRAETPSGSRAKTPPEAHVETPPEARAETLPEAHVETPPEARAETPPEARIETPPEPHAETPPEARAETPPGKRAETPPEVRADRPSRPAAEGGAARAELVEREMSALGKMDAESEARLRSNDELRQALADHSLAAAALKRCASSCFPPDVKPAQVTRLEKVLRRLARTGEHHEEALKKFLYDRRADLDTAINQIERVRTAADLDLLTRAVDQAHWSKRPPTQAAPKEIQLHAPPEATPAQVLSLKKVLGRIARTGEHDGAALTKFLHAWRDDLDTAIAQIKLVHTADQLDSWVKSFNLGIWSKKYPTKLTPAELHIHNTKVWEQGETGGKAAASGEKDPVGFVNPIDRGPFNQGIDDVMVAKGGNPETGFLYVMEYKGMTVRKGRGPRVAKSQMEFAWVVGNIERLHREGGEVGKRWAKILAKALSEGRLGGEAWVTPIVGGVPQTAYMFKDWPYPKFKIKLPPS